MIDFDFFTGGSPYETLGLQLMPSLEANRLRTAALGGKRWVESFDLRLRLLFLRLLVVFLFFPLLVVFVVFLVFLRLVVFFFRVVVDVRVGLLVEDEVPLLVPALLLLPGCVVRRARMRLRTISKAPVRAIARRVEGCLR